MMLIINIIMIMCNVPDLKSRERIYKMPPNRYNVSGFVEELPQLPEERYKHACAALPPTGVRPAQYTF